MPAANASSVLAGRRNHPRRDENHAGASSNRTASAALSDLATGQALHQVFHHQGGLLRGNGEKLVEAQMRLLVGNVRDRANDNKRYTIVVADVRDGCGFHFYRDGLREVVADFAGQ